MECGCVRGGVDDVYVYDVCVSVGWCWMVGGGVGDVGGDEARGDGEKRVYV